jgi:hypothetical protein
MNRNRDEDQRWLALIYDDRSHWAAEILGPSLWLLGLGATLRSEWLRRLAGAAPELTMIVLQVRPIGSRSTVIAEKWANTLAANVGVPLWSTSLETRQGVVAYWAAVCDVGRVDALAAEMGRSTACRDTLLVLVPTGTEVTQESGLPSLFLRHVVDAVNMTERIAETRVEARESGFVVIFELRDPDRNAGLALSNGGDEPPAAVIRVFTDRFDASFSGLHPRRFGPALC